MTRTHLKGPYAVNEAGAAGSEEPGLQRVFGLTCLQLAFQTGWHLRWKVEDWKKPEKIEVAELGCLLCIGILSLCVLHWQRARRGCLGITCFMLLMLFLTGILTSISMQCPFWGRLFAASSTAIITLTFFCVSTRTNLDITKYRVFVLIFLWIGIGCVGILSVVKCYKPDTREVELTLGIAGTLTFSLLLLYDVQTIMGGRLIVVKPDQTIYAIFQLHLAIMLTFVYLMMLKFL